MAASSTQVATTSPDPTNQPSIFQQVDLRNPTEKQNFLTALKDFHHGTVQPQIPSIPSFSSGQEPTRYPETLDTTITIKEIKGKGLGLFAARDIPASTILLFELPIITYIKADRYHSTLSSIISDLPPARQKAWYTLHAYMDNPKSPSLDLGILHTNEFEIQNVDGWVSGVFETASRINHACVPNSLWSWKGESGRMLFWNRWDLMEGEEITVDYGHGKRVLREWYGFECECGGCKEDKSESESGAKDN